MSVDGWTRILVLGGIRSGKSEFAESLVADLPAVRYVATARSDADDPEWTERVEAHRTRRPELWATEETGADPSRLVEVISGARPEETLLVDDLGGWVTVLLDPAHQPADDVATIAELVSAIEACPARLVLVSPEVGLSLVPATAVGRAFTDALGTTNQVIAEVCDTVVLVVAGQPVRVKPTPAGVAPADRTRGADRSADRDGAANARPADALPVAGSTEAVPAAAGPADGSPADAVPLPVEMPDVLTPAPPAPQRDTWTAPTMTLPMIATGLVIQPGMELPLPDEYAGPRALDRLAGLDLPGTGLGGMDRLIGFAAATQANPVPRPWESVRVLLLHGDHAGGSAAGWPSGESSRRADLARAGRGPLAQLAAEAGASLQVVDAPTAAPIEETPALSAEAVESALRYGWRLAEEAADSGVQLIVLAACGAGTEAATAAVLAATAGAEPSAVLARVIDQDGQIDDAAWMARCAAVRDAMRRVRLAPRGPKDILAELGGGDIAIATGVLLGATARRTPVLLDGPVGVAASLISRDFAGQARHWCMLPDHGGHPAVSLAADVLGLTPLLDLRLDLGEGGTALAALPLLRSILSLGACLPARAGHGDDDSAFTEPEPAGPGPATPAPPASDAGWEPVGQPGSAELSGSAELPGSVDGAHGRGGY